jgi:hypothetical protein
MLIIDIAFDFFEKLQIVAVSLCSYIPPELFTEKQKIKQQYDI